MSKEIIVNVGERETRIAVVEDGKLAELQIERGERVVGNLYKGRVDTVRPGMDAAFVDIGLRRNAFLYVGDVLPSAQDADDEGGEADDGLDEDLDDDADDDADGGAAGRAPRGARGTKRTGLQRRSNRRQQRITDVLKRGQEVLVQVTKGPRGTKGARVSTLISLPGRYLVLMPESDTLGISRKVVEGKERDRLRQIGGTLRQPRHGLIIRTEAEDKPEQDLRNDYEFLTKLWRQVQEASRRAKAPALVHQDLTLIYKTIRDVFGSDVTRLVIDDPEEYAKANELLDLVSPKLRGRVHLYAGEAPIFDHFGIEAELERSLKRKVWLKSGGYLIFDETEALTVIDVNTGKFTGGSNLSDTILRTNIDAAAEIARQLRVRDIGGIIVIDFIDMNAARDKQQVIKALETALKKDRTRTKISNISPLGLVEMTRKRTAETIAGFLTGPCPYCSGKGKLSTADTVSIAVERQLHRAAAEMKRGHDALVVTCHPDVAQVLIGEEGATIDQVEHSVRHAVFVRADATRHVEDFEVSTGETADLERRHCTHKRSQVVDCEVAASHLDPDAAAVGWVDGFLVELRDGVGSIGQRARVRLTDVRRSCAEGVVIGAHRG